MHVRDTFASRVVANSADHIRCNILTASVSVDFSAHRDRVQCCLGICMCDILLLLGDLACIGIPMLSMDLELIFLHAKGLNFGDNELWINALIEHFKCYWYVRIRLTIPT